MSHNGASVAAAAFFSDVVKVLEKVADCRTIWLSKKCNCFFKIIVLCNINHLSPVVQRVDNCIQWISGYSADKMYQFQYILSTG